MLTIFENIISMVKLHKIGTEFCMGNPNVIFNFTLTLDVKCLFEWPVPNLTTLLGIFIRKELSAFQRCPQIMNDIAIVEVQLRYASLEQARTIEVR